MNEILIFYGMLSILVIAALVFSYYLVRKGNGAKRFRVPHRPGTMVGRKH